ncbi:class I SAM-dependent methyltransferase [Polymorphobacter fuscus]|uniref:Methyltransferase domain-containing protein n=1 Tax=Sandarakinorhabdus fusca TaxID=1439888 RepID=A0A7C9KJX1_9SPHN|nr:class I SAM-dependent methyltransferase [Polymorphobacter fuscus]KAB7643917.1 class I SAM-dependent methyltransferase [Polymorphobacter fuscus]MQT18620.1 methyltransferase domain-containing protein [Polymorphobacter fuscus]NJC07013.1 hypothetical protein [Polymorphobacter fuscus]
MRYENDNAGVVTIPSPSKWPGVVNERLSAALARLHSEGAPPFIAEFRAALHQLRIEAGSEWHDIVLPLVSGHEAAAMARLCPIAGHAFARPRGYPGDAGLLDVIYRQPGAPWTTSDPVASVVTAMTHSAPPARSVRERRMILADAIDETAVRVQRPSILSLACGHLREVEWSLALTQGSIGRFVAVDQDTDSLASIARDYAERFPAIEMLEMSVRDVLRGGGRNLGSFDLIYAAGLYDYLPEPIARNLTERLFAMLNDGGRLLIGNYGEGLFDTAYMEAIMNWPLNWRGPVVLEALADGIHATQASRSVWPDTTGTCWYLDLQRFVETKVTA